MKNMNTFKVSIRRNKIDDSLLLTQFGLVQMINENATNEQAKAPGRLRR